MTSKPWFVSQLLSQSQRHLTRVPEKSVCSQNCGESEIMFAGYTTDCMIVVDSMKNDSNNNYIRSKYIYIRINNNTTNVKIITNVYNSEYKRMIMQIILGTIVVTGMIIMIATIMITYNYCRTCGSFDKNWNYDINTNNRYYKYCYNANDFSNYIKCNYKN